MFAHFGQVRQSITTLTRIFPIGSSARCISSSRGTDCRLQKSHQIAMHHASLLRKVKSRQHLQITASCRKELLNRKLCTACGKRIRFGKKLSECKVSVECTSYAVMRNARPGSFQFCAFARNDLCFATLPTNRIDRVGDL